MDDAAFQQRFDIARLVLERKYRWAKMTLRNLEPVARDSGTLAVDKHLRLYHGPGADAWSDKEFVGALWHEVQHILRHHPERLTHLPKKHKMPPKFANLAADLEINDDLRDQGVTLPQGVFYSEQFEQPTGLAAEDHFMRFVEKPPEDPDGSNGDDEDEQDGEGEGDGIPDGDCGSGAGGDPRPYEEPEPSAEQQARAQRDQRKQAEDIVEAAEQNKGGLPPGMDRATVEAAVEYLGRTEYDWRQTMAVEVRNAIEQRADEAEEYTFKRRSRRASVSDAFILPGSFRPIPKLGVVCDLSGSMDQVKLTASMQQLHGILERLAIPTFTVYPWNTWLIEEVGPIVVQSAPDIARVFKRRGGGTDMQAGVEWAVEHGDEVIIVLTDNETHWKEQGPWGIPVIIGGINRRKDASYPVPKWARLVDVEGEGDGYDH